MVLSRQFQPYPFMAWERLKKLIVWKQGQHVFACGGTGSGKSTVAGEFLPRRSQVVVCVSKGFDDIFATPYYSEYEIIRNWPPPRGKERVLLWPANAEGIEETADRKRQIFMRMFDDVLLRRGNWCVDIDEEHYMSERLRLRGHIADMLEQGRSAGISMWNNTQRPSGVPLATYVNSTLAFLFQSQEDYDVRRLGGLVNRHTTAAELMWNIERLETFEHHEFVFIDRSGRIPPVRSIVDVRKGYRTSGTPNREVRTASNGGRLRLAGSRR